MMDGFEILYGRPSVRQDPFRFRINGPSACLSRLSKDANTSPPILFRVVCVCIECPARNCHYGVGSILPLDWNAGDASVYLLSRSNPRVLSAVHFLRVSPPPSIQPCRRRRRRRPIWPEKETL